MDNQEQTQEKEKESVLLKFQEETVNHVLNLFKNDQKRVLIGDEAGLGKTRVAAQVVARVKAELEEKVVKDDDLYCIVYVCCNLQIAQQNIGILCNSANKVDLSQSRLSMQHFVYHDQKSKLKADKTLLLSLTPATSFKMTGGTGSADERALIYNCLILLDKFKESIDSDSKLSETLRGTVGKDKWLQHKVYYCKKIESLEDKAKEEYKAYIKSAMTRHLDELVDACAQEQPKHAINNLRRIFADISLETMKPDLVIMDEFQKFSSLLDSNNSSEECRIARAFFGNGKEPDKTPYILLLSATPYKPYTTLEEININNNDEQFQDFHRLIEFLHSESPEVSEAFRKTWKEYSTLLRQLDIKQIETTVSKHKEAEDMLYGVMGRTERSNKGLIKEVLPDLKEYMSEGDITSYVQMRQLVDSCKQHGVTALAAPVDYTKSCAYQLSFMENYKLKDKIEEAWNNGAGKGLKIDRLLLNADSIENHSLSQYPNAKLAYVMDSVFGKGRKATGVENLLWVPASQPYYTQKDNVFTRNSDFSKTLVFSSWGMVPRMLSCLISYECERRAGVRSDVNELIKDGPKSKGKTVLHTVSTWLADQYDPKTDYLKDIAEIKANIVEKVRTRLHDMAPNAQTAARVSSLDIHQLLLALDDPQKGVRNIHETAPEILADMAIGAPAMCLYRIFKEIGDKTPAALEDAKTLAEQTADTMLSIFNKAHGITAVNNTWQQDRSKSKNGVYFQKVVDYCIKGNLQAVLDEFVHMIDSKNISMVAERITDSFIDAGSLKVNTKQSFTTDCVDSSKSINMGKHFAIDLAGESINEGNAQHANNVRNAFNSPFLPFILSSTSVGQEGLDFHWYSRKMIHWNLPSNPQDLEQREGRINRYKCHSVRRNVAKLYGHSSAGSDSTDQGYISWKDMFEKAASELAVNKSGMIPLWYLPLEHEKFAEMEQAGRSIERIERIVPMYSLSEDVERYENLINVLTLYRLTMGQPRQEDLVKMLSKTSSPEIIDKLIFQLSPYFRKSECQRVSSLDSH